MPKSLVPIINGNNPITKNLIFCAPLHERGNTRAQDIVSKIYGTFQGTTPTWIKDLNGSVVNFVDGWIGWPANFKPFSNIFSVVALINPTGTTGTQFIFGGDASSSLVFRLDTNKLDVVKMNIADLGPSTGTITANVWTLVGITYNASGVLNYYRNGVNIGTLTSAQTFLAAIPQIGKQLTGNNSPFIGKIAFVYYWSRVLVPGEMKQLYTNPFQIYRNPIKPALNSGIR